MRNTVKLTGIRNVEAGGHVIINCPVGGLTYDQIQLELTNITVDQMKNYKVNIGPRSPIEVPSARYIQDLNTYYKRENQAGCFTHWFYRPEWATEEERSLCSLGTADISSLSIEFDLDESVVDPKIEASAVQRGPSNLGLITKIKRYPVTFATAGDQDIDNLARGGGARINAMHLIKAEGDVSKVSLETNNGTGAGKLIEAKKGLLEIIQKQHKREPISATMTHIDLNLLGKISGPMPTAGLIDMRVLPTIDSPGFLEVLVEYIEGYNGI